jgi:hypothetical protein
MTTFEFGLSTPAARVIGALVASHGVTDLNSLDCLLLYLVSWLAPLKPKSVTVVFCALSALHFAEDVGPRGSAALHAALLVVGARWGPQRAMELMMFYITFLHLPLHYARCWRRGRTRGLALAAVTSAAAVVAASRTKRERVTLTNGMQRAAIAHILYEAALAAGESEWTGST